MVIDDELPMIVSPVTHGLRNMDQTLDITEGLGAGSVAPDEVVSDDVYVAMGVVKVGEVSVSLTDGELDVGCAGTGVPVSESAVPVRGGV